MSISLLPDGVAEIDAGLVSSRS